MPAPHLPKNSKNRENQAGNAIVIILVMIALIAALSAVAMRSSNRTSSNMSAEKARMLAEQALRGLTQIGKTIQRLVVENGCSENQISFENDIESVGLYTNSNSPTDYKCHVFRPEGGGLSRSPTPVGVGDTSIFATDFFWVLTGNASIPGVGPEGPSQTLCSSNCSELLLIETAATYEVCKQFNLLTGVNISGDGEPPLDADGVSPDKFTGTYSDGTNSALEQISTGSGDYTSLLYGKKTGCFYVSGTPNRYHIYYTAIER